MSAVVIAVDTSGSITLNAPALAGSTTLTLPATSGTVALTSDVIGVNQTWQNLTGSRTLNSDNTNLTGKPIQVVVSLSTQNPSGSQNASTATALVGGVIVAFSNSSDSSGFYSTPVVFSFIVPAGALYRVNTVNNVATTTLAQWAELR